MSEPDHFLAEAAKLVDALRERMAGPRPGRQDDDVWGQAVREEPAHSAECRSCPICRAMAASRRSGVSGQFAEAGRSLFAALGKVVEAADQPVSRRETRPPGGWPSPAPKPAPGPASGDATDAG
jgi:hypothetical protein